MFIYIKWLAISSLGILMVACAPKKYLVPVESSNLNLPRSNIDSNKSELFVFMDSPVNTAPAVKLMIDNNIDYLSTNTYAFYELESGLHWIAVIGNVNTSYECKEFKANETYSYSINNEWGFIKYPRYILKNESIRNNINSKQIVQTNQNIHLPVRYSFTGISVVAMSNNEDLITIQKMLQKKFSEMSISEGNDIQIRLSILDYKEGSRLGRYLFYGLVDEKKFESLINIKAEIYKGENKIDEFISSKKVEVGIFGGSSDNLTTLITNDIASYFSCIYASKNTRSITQ